MAVTECFWCGVDPREEMPKGISPHSTWCPHHRSPPGPPRSITYANGNPMFAPDGMMLDEHGNRSIFDDIDE